MTRGQPSSPERYLLVERPGSNYLRQLCRHAPAARRYPGASDPREQRIAGPAISRPPGRCRILPRKLAVRGLPGAKRRDAVVGRALDRELCGDSMPGAGGRPGRSLQAPPCGCVTARGRPGGGCGVTALRQRPAPCVPTLRQRAKLPPHDGETPPLPQPPTGAVSRPSQHSPSALAPTA
jgi:hypothetical protein